jgi:predicted nucleic acid-binding protein
MAARHLFLDTNILVYAYDRRAGQRHHAAQKLIGELWLQEVFPAISVQVLQEFHVTLVRKGVSPGVAQKTVADYLKWDVVDNDRSLFVESLAAKRRWKLSFWDASIVAAARRAKAKILWSEDLSDAQDYGGVMVVNPLKSS